MADLNKYKSQSLPCAEYLHGSNPTFANLLQRVEQIRLLQQIFSQIVPVDLAKHCRVVNIQEQSLVIGTEQAHWATRLRYSTPEILGKLEVTPDIPKISSIRVIICQTPDLGGNKLNPKASISDQLASDLENLAENMDDEDIADCLRRISKHR